MNDDRTPRRPDQQAQPSQRRHPEQQHHKKHHDPRGHSPGNLAAQTPKGGASQDPFGQSGEQGAPDQTEHNINRRE